MKLLYVDVINSGISGDMFLAALLGLVESPHRILDDLNKLSNYLSGVSKLEINLIKKKISGILVNQIKIDVKESRTHRNSKSLINALNKFSEDTNFSSQAKKYANEVLTSLIQAEVEVHGELSENIHLHELSSVDTLIDILGVSKALDVLGGFNEDFEVYCSKLPLGGGRIRTAHGILPVPAPATLKILEKSNLVIHNGPIESELVTPTGAALLANLNPRVQEYDMKLTKITYSTGQKEFKDFLNMLRLFYGEIRTIDIYEKKHPLQKYLEPIIILETDVDDVSGEILGHFIQKFEEEEVLDVKILTGITKKNRPGHIIKVMCHPDKKFELNEKILEELGTLGVRMNMLYRVCIDRENKQHKIEIDDKRYELNYKISFIEIEDKKKIINIKPEFEDLKRISELSGFSLKKIQLFAQSQLAQLYKSDKDFI
ncbi:MAG: nickel pincer cofactor biosynthesis protein LarC [Promethearchaeota archaeon]